MEHLAAAKINGVGIANRSVEGRTGFTQTKRSSDEIVEMMGTPSPGGNNDGKKDGGEPGTPSRAPRRKDGGEGDGVMGGEGGRVEGEGKVEEVKASPRRIPKYKIALAANVLSPRRGMGAATSVS